MVRISEILIASLSGTSTIKQVVFGSFWSTTNAKRTVNDVFFLKRGGDYESYNSFSVENDKFDQCACHPDRREGHQLG